MNSTIIVKRVSAYTIVRAVTHTKGGLLFSDPRGSETTQPMEMKFSKLITSVNLAHMQNLVRGRKWVSSRRRGDVDTLCAFLFVVPQAALRLTLKNVVQRPMHKNTCFGGGVGR